MNVKPKIKSLPLHVNANPNSKKSLARPNMGEDQSTTIQTFLLIRVTKSDSLKRYKCNQKFIKTGQ